MRDAVEILRPPTLSTGPPPVPSPVPLRGPRRRPRRGPRRRGRPRHRLGYSFVALPTRWEGWALFERLPTSLSSSLQIDSLGQRKGCERRKRLARLLGSGARKQKGLSKRVAVSSADCLRFPAEPEASALANLAPRARVQARRLVEC